MTLRSGLARIWQQEDLNFLLTNRIPRQLATRFMGWFSQIEQPLVSNASIAAWRYLCNLDLEESRQDRFKSLHECFIRELKPEARPIDIDRAVLVASIRLHFADVLLNLRHRGPNVIACDASLGKGEEMGWFQHGSTIIMFAPRWFTLCEHIREGLIIRMGQPLLRLPI
jgi:phosphatidylserine decarboxylase